MATTEQQEDYVILRAQYAAINDAITGQLSNNKKYTYSTVESTHMAETNTLPELIEARKSTKEEINALLSQCGGSFVKLKNY